MRDPTDDFNPIEEALVRDIRAIVEHDVVFRLQFHLENKPRPVRS